MDATTRICIGGYCYSGIGVAVVFTALIATLVIILVWVRKLFAQYQQGWHDGRPSFGQPVGGGADPGAAPPSWSGRLREHLRDVLARTHYANYANAFTDYATTAMTTTPTTLPSARVPSESTSTLRAWIWSDETPAVPPAPPPMARADVRRAVGYQEIARQTHDRHLHANGVRMHPIGLETCRRVVDHRTCAHSPYACALVKWTLLAQHGGLWITDATILVADPRELLRELHASDSLSCERPPRLVMAGTRLRDTAAGFVPFANDDCVVCEPNSPAAHAVLMWLKRERGGIHASAFRPEHVGEHLTLLEREQRQVGGVDYGIVHLDGRTSGTIDACGRPVDPCDASVAFARRPFRCGACSPTLKWVNLQGLGTHIRGQSWGVDVSAHDLLVGDYWLSDVCRLALPKRGQIKCPATTKNYR